MKVSFIDSKNVHLGITLFLFKNVHLPAEFFLNIINGSPVYTSIKETSIVCFPKRTNTLF